MQKETLLDGRFESKGSKAPFRHVADDDCIVFQTLENPRQPIFGIQATTKRKSERRTTEQKKKRIKLGENRPKQGKKQAGQAVESPGEKKDPSKEQDTLLSKEIKTYRQLIMNIFKDLKLFPKVIDEAVADYAEKFFFNRPRVITKFKLDLKWIIRDNTLVFCGKHDNEAARTIDSYSLLDSEGEIQSKLSRDEKLHYFDVYSEMQIFVNSDNVMIFKRADSDKTLSLSSQIEGSYSIAMAQNMSRNGLVWINRYSGLILINVVHMLSTGMEKVIWHKHVSKNTGFIHSLSLNPAGTVLAYVSSDWKVHIYSVLCDNGEISLHECLILTEHPADKVMLLEDNILGIKAIFENEYFFYRLNVNEKTAELVSVKIDFKCFVDLSYHAADDFVVGIFKEPADKSYGFSRVFHSSGTPNFWLLIHG